MATWAKWTLAGAEDAIEAFGRRLREGRQRASLSQINLEQRSGVDQSLISRLERAKAPHASLERVIRLGQALGENFPLGYCPHQHACMYRPDWKPAPALGYPAHLAKADQTAESDAVTSRQVTFEATRTAKHVPDRERRVPDLEQNAEELELEEGYELEERERKDDPGLSHGLRWTPDGIISVRE
jgi:transcriptional regulator with XRE-family HTH domain